MTQYAVLTDAKEFLYRPFPDTGSHGVLVGWKRPGETTFHEFRHAEVIGENE